MSKGKKAHRKAKNAAKPKAAVRASVDDKELRAYLADALTWGEAHADWKKALVGLDPAHRGVRPAGSPYSAWELLEHARISQEDILDFATNPKYRAREWPASYWPNSPAPPGDAAWEKSAKEFAKGTEEMAKLVKNPQTNLFGKIPHGTGQTMLRQALLLADHNAYHLGQFVLVRRLLGTWAAS